MTGKKIILSTIFLFMTFFINSEIPETLKGTWIRSDRIIFLEDSNNISVILKEYYGWYYDRTVEPEEFSDVHQIQTASVLQIRRSASRYPVLSVFAKYCLSTSLVYKLLYSQAVYQRSLPSSEPEDQV